MKALCVLVAFLLSVFLYPSVAPAQVAGPISELRAGALAHDIGFLGGGKEDGVDLNAEVLFHSPRILDFAYSPRPHLGIQVNGRGQTSQIYAGLTWTFWPFDRLWVGFGAGGTLHNGETGDNVPGRKALGSHVLFRLSGEVGYDVTDHVSVSLYFDHESNAGLADNNQGLNNAGIRVGYRF